MGLVIVDGRVAHSGSSAVALREAVTSVSRAIEDLNWTSLSTDERAEVVVSFEDRKAIIKRARLASRTNPLAIQAAALLVNYTLGDGVVLSAANRSLVARIVDELWENPVNQEVFTGHQALSDFIVGAWTDGAQYLVFFPDKEEGTVELGSIDPLFVEDVIHDPENHRVPLWYKVRKPKGSYDFAAGYWLPDAGVGDDFVYYRHWRNDQKPGTKGAPPAEKIGDGLVYPARRGKGKFGQSALAGAVDWLKAHKEFMEDRATITRAAAAVAWRKKRKNSTASDIAAEVERMRSSLSRAGSVPGYDTNPPTPTASTIIENENTTMEWVKTDTGGQAALADERILRMMAGSAMGGIPNHYFGDEANANLATACHDDQTEVLTEDGWLGLEALKGIAASGRPFPRVAGFDPERGIVYQQPKDDRLYVYPYRGEMLRFRNRQQDIMVTPNHRMLVRYGDDTNHLSGWEKVRADALGRRRAYQRVAAPLAVGARVDAFVLPGVPVMQGSRAGSVRLLREAPPLAVEMDRFLAWLGWYVSEGCGYDASVAQSVDSPDLHRIRAACEGLGVPGIEKVRGRTWVWRPRHPKQWKVWLNEHVGRYAHEKRLPGFVFGLEVTQQRVLLDALMGGDGHEGTTGRYYSTHSERLADDVQRLAMHVGSRASVRVVERERSGRSWREYVVWLREGLSPSRGRDSAYTVLAKPERVPYEGEVWCFALPCDTLITRRYGRVAFHCNTAMELPLLKQYQNWQTWLARVIDDVILFTLETAHAAKRLGERDREARYTDRAMTSEKVIDQYDGKPSAQGAPSQAAGHLGAGTTGAPGQPVPGGVKASAFGEADITVKVEGPAQAKKPGQQPGQGAVAPVGGRDGAPDPAQAGAVMVPAPPAQTVAFQTLERPTKPSEPVDWYVDVDFSPIVQKDIKPYLDALKVAGEMLPSAADSQKLIVGMVLTAFGVNDLDSVMDRLFPALPAGAKPSGPKLLGPGQGAPLMLRPGDTPQPTLIPPTPDKPMRESLSPLRVRRILSVVREAERALDEAV